MSGEHIAKPVETAPRPENQASVFAKRKRTFLITFLGAFGLFAVSSYVANYDVADGFGSIPKAIAWMAANFVPDERA